LDFEIPDELHYSTDDDWVLYEDDLVTLVVTDFAQHQLGDIVFVELPGVGTEVGQGGDAAVVESVKAASEIYAPVAGEVVEVNGALSDDPSLVNSDPFGNGWFFKIKIADADAVAKLMDENAYKEYVESLQ